jgi:hypothetical protein
LAFRVLSRDSYADVDFVLVHSDAITQIAIGRDAWILKKFVEPAASCALSTSDLKN